MLELTTTSDPAHSNRSVLLYGRSGVGKTTFATTTLPVEDDSEVLYVAVDPGYAAIRNRNFVMALPKNWAEIQWLFATHLPNHAKAYKWVVIDGLDELGKICLAEEMGKTADGRQAYGKMAEKVEAMVKFIRDLGMNTVFITHEEEADEQAEYRYRPRFPGKALTGQLVDFFDEVMCLRMKTKVTDKGSEVVRMVQTKPEADMRYHTKDRIGKLDPWEKPDMAAIFEKLNKE